MFSGRHLPDTYNNILRPRGIELYGGTENAPTPKLELDMIKDDNLIA